MPTSETGRDAGQGAWRERFRVRSYDLDARGAFAPSALCRALQEAAGRHAAALGVAVERLAPLGLAWVLSRLRAHFSGTLAWQDTYVVETWPVAIEGLRALRDFVIEDGSGATIGAATSAWLIVDGARRRPVRLPEFVREIPCPTRERALVDALGTIPDPGPEAVRLRLTARRSDCDLNGHVNNTRYAEWLVEGWPENLWHEGALREVELAFLAECREGEAVLLESASTGDALVQRLLRERDGRELLRARSVFEATYAR